MLTLRAIEGSQCGIMEFLCDVEMWDCVLVNWFFNLDGNASLSDIPFKFSTDCFFFNTFILKYRRQTFVCELWLDAYRFVLFDINLTCHLFWQFLCLVVKWTRKCHILCGLCAILADASYRMSDLINWEL